jgi:hypothetical protein
MVDTVLLRLVVLVLMEPAKSTAGVIAGRDEGAIFSSIALRRPNVY